MYNNRLRFQKTDTIAIGLVALLAILIFWCYLPEKDNTPAYVEVYQDGQLVETLPLSESRELEIHGDYTNTITIQEGKAAVTHSNCPGTDCVNSGWISTSGRSIVCLPNSLEIRVVGADSDVDFVVR